MAGTSRPARSSLTTEDGGFELDKQDKRIQVKALSIMTRSFGAPLLVVAAQCLPEWFKIFGTTQDCGAGLDWSGNWVQDYEDNSSHSKHLVD